MTVGESMDVDHHFLHNPYFIVTHMATYHFKLLLVLALTKPSQCTYSPFIYAFSPRIPSDNPHQSSSQESQVIVIYQLCIAMIGVIKLCPCCFTETQTTPSFSHGSHLFTDWSHGQRKNGCLLLCTVKQPCFAVY